MLHDIADTTVVLPTRKIRKRLKQMFMQSSDIDFSDKMEKFLDTLQTAVVKIINTKRTKQKPKNKLEFNPDDVSR